jgi:histone-lysine N-methyltransferase SETMAR
MGFKKKLGNWIPHRLRDDQLEQRVTICNSLLSRRRNFDWLRDVVTGDEKWVLYTNEVRKGQWVLPGEQPDPDPKPEIHAKKILLSVFWDSQGILSLELLQPNTTMNADNYCNQLDRLRRIISIERPYRDHVILLHDNARPHTAIQTHQKIVNEFGWEILPHPPYSPDCAPTDYHLFRHLSRDLAGRKFSDFTHTQNEVRSILYSYSKDFFAKGIEKLPTRWEYIVEHDGTYYP